MTERAQAAYTLERLVAVWRRRKWLAFAAFGMSAAVVAGLVPSLPDVYRAAAVVLVERQQVPEEFVRSTVTSVLETRLHTMSQEILSRARLEQLIERFDLYPESRQQLPLDVVADRMRRDIVLDLRGVESTARGGNLVAFTISYMGADPERVAAVTNTLASYYLEENTRVRERQASGTAEFLRRQLEAVKVRVEEQEQKLSAFRAKYVGETPQHMQDNLGMIHRLNEQLRLNAERQNRAVERREAMARQSREAESLASLLSESSVRLPARAPADATAIRLTRLRQELGELRTRFSDRYPDVVNLKAEIATLEKQQAAAIAAAPPPAQAPPAQDPAANAYALQLKEATAELELEIKTLRAEEKQLRQDLVVFQQRVANTPRREQEFQTLSRDYDTTSNLYRTLLQRYEEAQMAETLEQRQKGEQFRILEAALPPSAPVAPNRVRLVVAGLIVALGLAVGLALLAEQLDTSFHSIEELRGSTPVPVLVGIPRVVTPKDVWHGRRWAIATVLLISLGIGLCGAAAYAVGSGRAPVIGPVARAWLLRS
jgi:succinoglycan biosynthesis transport protein ExoP